MAKKLHSRSRVTRPPSVSDEENNAAVKSLVQDQQKLLSDIQGKIFKSPALNGGFDAMMFKIETMQNDSKIMGEKVDSIHECLFHPDDGLYARVKASASSESVDRLQRSMHEIQIWKDAQDRSMQKEEQTYEKNAELISSHEKQIAEFKLWKDRITSIVKWFMVSLGGAMIALIFKLIYEFVKGHIQIV